MVSVVEHRLAPRAEGPPAHYHERMCDAFYVLEGTLTLRAIVRQAKISGPVDSTRVGALAGHLDMIVVPE